jgi:hypothetical protein
MMEFALRANGPSAPSRPPLALVALESRLTPAASITDMGSAALGDGWYVIYGQVNSDLGSPWGLTVEFTAASNTIHGQRVLVEQDGSFALFVDLGPLDYGFVTASFVDWDETVASTTINVNVLL